MRAEDYFGLSPGQHQIFRPVPDFIPRNRAFRCRKRPGKKSGLFNALREKSSGDGILQKVEKLYLGNPNIIYALSPDKADEGTIRETMFLTWTKEKYSVQSSRISDFEIEDITFEVGGKNKKGKQLKEADKGYIVKDNIEYAAGKNIPIWMFGFIY